MKSFKVAVTLLTCSQGISVNANAEKGNDLEDKEAKLSQSFISAFNMKPPKLMNTSPLTKANINCPTPGQ